MSQKYQQMATFNYYKFLYWQDICLNVLMYLCSYEKKKTFFFVNQEREALQKQLDEANREAQKYRQQLLKKEQEAEAYRQKLEAMTRLQTNKEAV